jgi:hypothetical protein
VHPGGRHNSSGRFQGGNDGEGIQSLGNMNKGCLSRY